MPQSHLRAAQQAAARFAKAREARDSAIVAAHEAGESTRTIAKYVNLTHQRVAQIVRKGSRLD